MSEMIKILYTFRAKGDMTHQAGSSFVVLLTLFMISQCSYPEDKKESISSDFLDGIGEGVILTFKREHRSEPLGGIPGGTTITFTPYLISYSKSFPNVMSARIVGPQSQILRNDPIFPDQGNEPEEETLIQIASPSKPMVYCNVEENALVFLFPSQLSQIDKFFGRPIEDINPGVKVDSTKRRPYSTGEPVTVPIRIRARGLVMLDGVVRMEEGESAILSIEGEDYVCRTLEWTLSVRLNPEVEPVYLRKIQLYFTNGLGPLRVADEEFDVDGRLRYETINEVVGIQPMSVDLPFMDVDEPERQAANWPPIDLLDHAARQEGDVEPSDTDQVPAIWRPLYRSPRNPCRNPCQQN